ncbi:hypothetical protein N7539_001367 [Penicillium diatomitis]|uniref:Uncharacterized protein n=1 Tax=Penicillium diatomitis TaxID=2819901 RepID=A0A9W9XGM0_9EURO|nr:uncharacterized protein N7539_001367 [Penicillium diatomitis]KAJ5492621.1 hypothetical protein N7539_001367 [Penicillium diatomitis]
MDRRVREIPPPATSNRASFDGQWDAGHGLLARLLQLDAVPDPLRLTSELLKRQVMLYVAQEITGRQSNPSHNGSMAHVTDGHPGKVTQHPANSRSAVLFLHQMAIRREILVPDDVCPTSGSLDIR